MQTTLLYLGLLSLLSLGGCLSAETSPDEPTDGSSGQATVYADESSTGSDGTPTTGAPGSTSDTTGAIGPDPDVCPGGKVIGSILLANQADVDRMHGCTFIEDRLDIMGDDIVDLGPLAALVKVGNYMEIRANPGLVSLAGLEQLESVGVALFIDSNPALVDLEGLTGLRHVGGLEVSQNSALTSLEGLRNVIELSSWSPMVFFGANDQLASLAGIEAIVADDRLQLAIVAHPKLTDLSALAGVDRLEDLEISGNTALTSLAGLEGLSHVAWALTLVGNDGLVDLGGLSGLRKVGYLELGPNAGLTDLAGLAGLQSVEMVIVDELGPLHSLAGLSGLVDVGTLLVSDNTSLTSLAGLTSLSRLDELILRRCSGLSSLAGLESVAITAVLEVTQNKSLAALTGIAPLDTLDALYMHDNDSIVSLTDLGTLMSVRDLTVIQHAKLPQADAEAWAAARTVTGKLKIDGNLGTAPHLDDCPWVHDNACDEPEGTGLCPAGTDFDDCPPE